MIITLFLEDIWLNDTPIIDGVYPDKRNIVNFNANVSDFINECKKWNLNNLHDFFRRILFK